MKNSPHDAIERLNNIFDSKIEPNLSKIVVNKRRSKLRSLINKANSLSRQLYSNSKAKRTLSMPITLLLVALNQMPPSDKFRNQCKGIYKHSNLKLAEKHSEIGLNKYKREYLLD